MSATQAHQKHHGTGELSDKILAARIANGWTPEEIAANRKPLGRDVAQEVEDADNRANGYQGPSALTKRETELSRAMWEVR